MNAIDICMTAVRRPEIVDSTLQSFSKLFNGYKNCRLIINIDPVGGTDNDKNSVIKICQSFFQNLRVNIPKSPSFPKAFIWVWKTSTTPLIFHLEDDWKLLKIPDIQQIQSLLRSESNLALLRLSAFPSGPLLMKNWNKYFPWNGRYFECPGDLLGSIGFCGHPSFIKREFIQNCLPLLNDISNPEKQFHRRGSKLLEEVLKWRYGVFAERVSNSYIQDIGRKWISKTDWRKKGNKSHFTEWENIGE